MTRELKLSLVVGFALVIAVASLFADYLSEANHAQLDNKIATQPQLTHPAPQEPVLTLTGREAAEPPARLDPVFDLPNPTGDAPQANPAPSEPKPFTLVQGSGQPSDDFGTLKRAVEQVGGRIANNELHLPGAVAADFKQPGASSGPTPTPTPATPAPVDHSGDIRRPVSAQVPHEVTNVTVPAPAMREYTIADGDSVYKIAKKFYNNGEQWTKIQAANPGKIGPKGEIRVGVLLKIPDVAPLPAGTPAKPETSKPEASKPDTSKSDTSKPDAKTTGSIRTYTVQKGDSLQAIAAKQLKSASRADDILKLNSDQIKNADSIRVGMVLKLPAK